MRHDSFKGARGVPISRKTGGHLRSPSVGHFLHRSLGVTRLILDWPSYTQCRLGLSKDKERKGRERERRIPVRHATRTAESRVTKRSHRHTYGRACERVGRLLNITSSSEEEEEAAFRKGLLVRDGQLASSAPLTRVMGPLKRQVVDSLLRAVDLRVDSRGCRISRCDNDVIEIISRPAWTSKRKRVIKKTE